MKMPSIDKVDFILVVGLLLLGIGLWLQSPSLSLSTVGGIITIIGLMGAIKG